MLLQLVVAAAALAAPPAVVVDMMDMMRHVLLKSKTLAPRSLCSYERIFGACGGLFLRENLRSMCRTVLTRESSEHVED